MTAEDHMYWGGRYYDHARKAIDEKDRAYWMNRLDTAVEVSREEFGPDVWVTKELEGLLDDLRNA